MQQVFLKFPKTWFHQFFMGSPCTSQHTLAWQVLHRRVTYVFHLLPFSILILFNTSSHTLLQHTHLPPAARFAYLKRNLCWSGLKKHQPPQLQGHAWITYWDMPQMLRQILQSQIKMHCITPVVTFLLGRRHYFKINLNLKATFPVVKTLFPGEYVLNFWTESL